MHPDRADRLAIGLVLGVYLAALVAAVIFGIGALQRAKPFLPPTPAAIAAEIADAGRDLDGADDFADFFSIEASAAAESDGSLGTPQTPGESPTTDLDADSARDSELADSPPEPSAERWTDAHVRDALVGQPVMTRRIVFCEIGRSGTYDPYAIGPKGELGPAQLLPGTGNGLAIFYRWGGEDPNSPYDAVWFINRVQAERMLGSQYPRTRFGCPGSI